MLFSAGVIVDPDGGDGPIARVRLDCGARSVLALRRHPVLEVEDTTSAPVAATLANLSGRFPGQKARSWQCTDHSPA